MSEVAEIISEAGRTDLEETSIPVVGIGVCIRSLRSLETLFAGIEADVGAAYLIAVRQQEGLDVGTVVDVLSRQSRLPVTIGAGGERVERDRIYVGGPDDMITLSNGYLGVRPAAEPVGHRGTIDSMLISIAEHAHDRAVAVILSGLGGDGTAGVTATKKFGGLSIGEAGTGDDHAGAQGGIGPFGAVDLHVPIGRIASEITRYLGNVALLEREGREVAPEQIEAHVAQITTILRNVTGHDFHGYKRGTFLRRVHRRLQVLHLENIEAYVGRLRSDRQEVQDLFQDLLIGVTQFFRDPQEFEVLEGELPRLFEGKGADDQFRVWVLGCATGEEAYSLAILLREHMATLAQPPQVQIFATDLDARALGLARAGRYTDTIANHVRADRLERWFVREGDTYCVSKELREMCIFSPHNIVKDAPFSRVDLLSCRNLLIYLNADLQNRVIPIFHFSIRPAGVLFLGSSENITRHQKLFASIDRRSRVFRRLETATRVIPDFPLSLRPRAADLGDIARAEPAAASRLTAAVSRQAEVIAERYAPAYVVVDRQFDVLHFSGRTGRFLEPVAGVATLNLISLIHRDLRTELRSALHRALSSGQRVETPRLLIQQDDRATGVNLTVEPIGGGDVTSLIVLFQDLGALPQGVAHSEGGANDEHVERLESELRLTRDRLQATIEELESTNEELKSSNEEYQSINEELQSANEEMETSKEELQSVNEELQTVNGELGHRVTELGRSNSDLKNLLEATQIATLFLDNDLRVRSFTPSSIEIFHLLETDVGRPLDHVVSRVAYPNLQEDVRRVLKTLAPIDRTVVDPLTGRHFAAKVLPYRRVDNYISGAVVTFTDLTAVHQAEMAVRESEERLHSLVEGLTQLVWRAVDIGNWTWASRQWQEYTGQSEEDSHGQGWMVPLHPDDRLLAKEAWSAAAEQGGFQVEYRIRRTSDGAYRWFQTRATPIRDEHGETVEWIGTSTDVNDLRDLQGRQGVLVAELQHRTRNLIGVVRQMAQKTARGSSSLDDFRDRFRDRLDSLARVQGLLSRLNEHDRVTFDELIRTELAAHGVEPGQDGRVTIEGPSGIRLRSTTVQTLAMALHELATNAVKYGALGQPEAELAVRWRIEVDAAGAPGDQPWLHIDWRESGVKMLPQATTSPGGGQGRELIERALPYQLAARTTYVLAGDGVHCSISMPVSATNEANEVDNG
ncbi:CheR family methyltransferase [Sphingomonas endolithica]|uniref:CheR family methyltransferase n=1 Tax=Sphingomonas endolithica TaxID=2972485 RepID=UPI0021AF785D|nr:CheR family methyltransferase [Sphingomonas sp. ZFBP2030]